MVLKLRFKCNIFFEFELKVLLIMCLMDLNFKKLIVYIMLYVIVI